MNLLELLPKLKPEFVKHLAKKAGIPVEAVGLLSSARAAVLAETMTLYNPDCGCGLCSEIKKGSDYHERAVQK